MRDGRARRLISSGPPAPKGSCAQRFCLVSLASITSNIGSTTLQTSRADFAASAAPSRTVSKTQYIRRSSASKLGRQPLLVQPLPHSTAPWHTLRYCRREVSHLAGIVRLRLGTSIAYFRSSWRRQRQAARAKRIKHVLNTGKKTDAGNEHRHGFHFHMPHMPWKRHHENAHADAEERLRVQAQQPAALAQAAEQRGLDRQKALDIRGALAAFEEAVSHVPDDARMLACLSKQWSDITFVPETPKAEGKLCAEKGISLATQAIEMDSSCALGHIAAGVGRGRLTFFVDNGTKVKLAADAQQDALAALAADPDNDLAHHLLGRWHFEMSQVNFVVRTMIRVVFGTALKPGTLQEALEAYQKAAELNPGRLIHRVELARTALRLGHTSLAARELLVAEGLVVEDINAHLTSLDGKDMLAKLRREGKLLDVLQPALPLQGNVTQQPSEDGDGSVTEGKACPPCAPA